jgi:hypothetical protein
MLFLKLISIGRRRKGFHSKQSLREKRRPFPMKGGRFPEFSPNYFKQVVGHKDEKDGTQVRLFKGLFALDKRLLF